MEVTQTQTHAKNQLRPACITCVTGVNVLALASARAFAFASAFVSAFVSAFASLV